MAFGRRVSPVPAPPVQARPEPAPAADDSLSPQARAFAAQLRFEPGFEAEVRDWNVTRRLEKQRARGPWRLATLILGAAALAVQLAGLEEQSPWLVWLLRIGATACAVMAFVAWRRAIHRRTQGG